MAKRTNLILASSSPRRQELISVLNLPVIVYPSNTDEQVKEGMTPKDIVEQLSLRKAYAVKKACNEIGQCGIVVGSDTIVVAEGRILGKPLDREDAVRMLRILQGCTHEVYTGIACLHTDSNTDTVSGQWTKAYTMREAECFGSAGQYRILSESVDGQADVMVGHTLSSVKFRPMSTAEIEAYVDSGEPMDKAGSYGVQGLGSVFVERIEGDYYSIMGLPLNVLYSMLTRLGISPFL